MVEGEIKNVTISQSSGKWFASIQTEREAAIPTPSGDMIGIDVGIARFATLSDGAFYEPCNSFKTLESALRKTQQAMSRKVKFSNNWKKAKAKVHQIHSTIANAEKISCTRPQRRSAKTTRSSVLRICSKKHVQDF
jgi:putative transposase